MDLVSAESTPRAVPVSVLFISKSTIHTFTSGKYVSDVKKQISADFGLCAEDFNLIWGAKILRDDIAIDDSLVADLRLCTRIVVKKKL